MDTTNWKRFAEKLKRADMDTKEKTEVLIDWLLEEKKTEKPRHGLGDISRAVHGGRGLFIHLCGQKKRSGGFVSPPLFASKIELSRANSGRFG